MASNPLPTSLLIALGVQVACQGIKFIAHSLRSGRPSWKSLVTFGGMPSAHSAVVTALATSVGIIAGFTSDLFALAAIFGGIVIMDAYRLRGNVQKQAKLLNRLQARNLPESERVSLEEMIGHSLPEIAVGIVLALVVAIPLALLLR